MEKVKICPACGHKNPYTNLNCEQCDTDITSIEPIEDKPIEPDPSLDKTIVEAKKYVIFNFNNFQIKVYDKEIIGRHSKGAGIFQNILEVSRRHAEITFEGSDAYITDLNSTNGVFINGRKIHPGVPEKISEGSEIRLCSKVTLKVEKIFSGTFEQYDISEEYEKDNSISNSNKQIKTCKNCGMVIDLNEKICPYCLENPD